ncbi:recombinase family protein [Streptomyces sp. NPDC057271]|uniref:recombinase family protein n=1 Tax=unclassified Streptomyces TaxID=2593676 RepID=UPI003629396A
MGYARCSAAQQELQSQLDALTEAGCDPGFSEKISTRITVRPEFVRRWASPAPSRRPSPTSGSSSPCTR